MQHDYSKILIKNGRIIDPSTGKDEIGDIAIQDDRIVRELIHDNTRPRIFDANGYLVMPGLIEFHTHLDYGGSEVGINPDLMLIPNGVTTAVDAGTCGISNYEMFSRHIVHNAAVTIKTLLNVSNAGQITEAFPENLDPQFFNPTQIARYFKRYQNEMIGLKIRIGKRLVGQFGMDPLIRAIEIAEQLGTFLSVHVIDPPCDYDEIMPLLRPGDVLVHPFHGRGRTIINEHGSIHNSLWEARERGVLIDLACARWNSNYSVARQAIGQGFYPDFYSTDIVRTSIYEKPVFSLSYVLSTYLNLGVPLIDLIRSCSVTAAAKIGLADQRGTLKPGAFADVVVMKLVKRDIVFEDMYGNLIHGDRLLVPQLTIKDGRVLYQNPEFNI